MIVTVTGGRQFRDREYVRYVLDGMHEAERVTILRHGGANGTDSLAAEWAVDHYVPMQAFYAKWESEGKAAGPRRNARMLDARPVTGGLIAFPGGHGTRNCMLCARRRKIPVFDAGALYQEWLERPKSLGEVAVEATRALLDEMKATEAFQGLLRLDLGGKGDIPADLSPNGQIRPELGSEGGQDVVE